MSSRKNGLVALGFVLSVSFISAAVAAWLVSCHYSRASFDLVNAVCCEIIEQEPETQKIVSAALKVYTEGNPDGLLEDPVLSALGYHVSDFSELSYRQAAFFAAVGLAAGVSLFFFTFFYRSRAENRRIKDLAGYLEQVNNGKALILSASGEDDFSRLEDEIYKTVTFLYQTKEQAVQTRNDFAENLSNIAHQIKTPITAISLAVQRMKQASGCAAAEQARTGHVPEPEEGQTAAEQKEHASERKDGHTAPEQKETGPVPEQNADYNIPKQNENRTALEQIEKQLSRLTYLEESLLVLARLDAGTLVLQKEETDVFTLLTLAADNLQELFRGSGTSVEIREQGELCISADMEWTMEAIMNLMKNCMEHAPRGTVHGSYARNPLYTEILIWDEGKGFAREDIPHLFERFYRGQNAHEGGIGIGLALAKEIIERQNGTIRAANKPGGGALFEIRFYTL